MPKTKHPAPRGKTPKITKPDMPSLEALSAKARGETTTSSVENTSDEEDETVATIVRPPPVSKRGAFTDTAQMPKNLKELFTEEETVIETITLNGGRTQNTATSERMKIFLRVRPFLSSEISRNENKVI